jgi:hypothetical protein
LEDWEKGYVARKPNTDKRKEWRKMCIEISYVSLMLSRHCMRRNRGKKSWKKIVEKKKYNKYFMSDKLKLRISGWFLLVHLRVASEDASIYKKNFSTTSSS